MSVETSIYTALKSLVSNRVYRDVAPDDNTTYPIIVFQQVGGLPVNFLEVDAPSQKNARFQVKCVGGPEKAQNRDTIATLSRSVENTLRAYTALQTTVLGAPVAQYDEATDSFWTHQDFSFWHES